MLREGIRRWWTRYPWQTILVMTLLAGAFWLRQAQVPWLAEAWYWLNWPVLGLTGSQPPVLTNHRLDELQGQISSLQQENLKLRSLLNLPAANLSQPVAAEIIGRNGDHWWQQVIINRGSADGIEEGSPVLAPGGLIGEITQVADHAARVRLISDPRSRIGVMIGRTGAMGILVGQYKNEAALEFFDSQTQVRIGDLIVTSGLSSRFPPNLVVGKIKSPPDKQAQPMRVKVSFTAPMDGLQWVSVYPKLPTTPPLSEPQADVPAQTLP